MSKYKNPINKPEHVTISRLEYVKLINTAAKMEVLRRLIEEDKKYMASDLLEIMFKGVE